MKAMSNGRIVVDNTVTTLLRKSIKLKRIIDVLATYDLIFYQAFY